jgi:hypothetical protein
MAQAVRYVKAGGILCAFGAANGRLTTPVMRAADSPLGAGGVPQDDREVEVFYAGLAAVGLFSELGVQVCAVMYTVYCILYTLLCCVPHTPHLTLTFLSCSYSLFPYSLVPVFRCRWGPP